MRRGIVTHPVEYNFFQNNSIISMDNQLTEADVNYFALYWDDIVILDTKNISIGIPKSEQLQECGVLRRPKMPLIKELNPLDFPDLYAKFQIDILDELRRTEKNTEWHFHQTSNKLFYSKNEERNLQVRMDLVGCLRVPDNDINVNDILEFKHNHKADFEALHEYIDKLYMEVIESKDFNLKNATNFSILSEAITNLDRIIGSKWRNPIRINKSVNLEFDLSQVYDFSTPAITGLMTGFYGGILPGMLSALATAIPSVIKLQPTWVGFRDKPTKELAYISKGINLGLLK